MKKILILLVLGLLFIMPSNAQKFGYIDTDYILSNVPAYKAAKDKLDKLATDWQKEIETLQADIDKMYKNFQTEKVLLSDEMQQKREEEIVVKEKAMKDLQKKYFGKEGDLYKKREELIKPIQDEIYAKVKEIAVEGNYAVIFDTSSGMSMVYTDPKYDKSDEVLERLGYKN